MRWREGGREEGKTRRNECILAVFCKRIKLVRKGRKEEEAAAAAAAAAA